MGVGGQRHVPASLPPRKTRYPLYRRLGGPQGRSGRVRKILPIPGFHLLTVQLVASRYAVWAIPAPFSQLVCFKNMPVNVHIKRSQMPTVPTHGLFAISARYACQMLPGRNDSMPTTRVLGQWTYSSCRRVVTSRRKSLVCLSLILVS
jgi:hypothetical protein